MTVETLGSDLAAIAASGRADAADDALALLADAYFFQSAGLWSLGLAMLHYRAGFGVSDVRPIPDELWGQGLTRAIRERMVVRVDAAPPAWSHAQRPHVVVPLLDEGDVVRGALIASTDAPDVPDEIREQARALVPLLEYRVGSPRRIADDLERTLAGSLWAALLAVQEGSDVGSGRAAAALRAALADLRAACATLRDALPRVESLAEAATAYGDAYGIAVEHDGFPGEDALDPNDRTALIAVIREALENAAVHGRARRARIAAGRTDDGLLLLVVEDDGSGATKEEIEEARRRGGLGLAAIEGHAIARGGTTSFGRSDLGGLRVEVALPGA